MKIKRQSWIWLIFGGGSLAALLAWRPRRAQAAPVPLPDVPPQARQTTTATNRPAGRSYAGRSWLSPDAFAGWVVGRYHDPMDAAEERILTSRGYTNEDDWFNVQTDNPDEAAQIVSEVEAARLDALRKAIAADRETAQHLMSMMRWAQMQSDEFAEGAGRNEDQEMYRWAFQLGSMEPGGIPGPNVA